MYVVTPSIKSYPGSPDSATMVLLCRVSPATDFSLLCLDQHCTACFRENWSSIFVDTVSYAKHFLSVHEFVERFPSGYGTSGDVAGAWNTPYPCALFVADTSVSQWARMWNRTTGCILRFRAFTCREDILKARQSMLLALQERGGDGGRRQGEKAKSDHPR